AGGREAGDVDLVVAPADVRIGRAEDDVGRGFRRVAGNQRPARRAGEHALGGDAAGVEQAAEVHDAGGLRGEAGGRGEGLDVGQVDREVELDVVEAVRGLGDAIIEAGRRHVVDDDAGVAGRIAARAQHLDGRERAGGGGDVRRRDRAVAPRNAIRADAG